MIRVASRYLEDIIAHTGELPSGPVDAHGVLRLALDLREAREKIAELESELQSLRGRERPAVNTPSKRLIRVIEEVAPGKKADRRA